MSVYFHNLCRHSLLQARLQKALPFDFTALARKELEAVFGVVQTRQLIKSQKVRFVAHPAPQPQHQSGGIYSRCVQADFEHGCLVVDTDCVLHPAFRAHAFSAAALLALASPQISPINLLKRIAACENQPPVSLKAFSAQAQTRDKVAHTGFVCGFLDAFYGHVHQHPSWRRKRAGDFSAKDYHNKRLNEKLLTRLLYELIGDMANHGKPVRAEAQRVAIIGRSQTPHLPLDTQLLVTHAKPPVIESLLGVDHLLKTDQRLEPYAFGPLHDVLNDYVIEQTWFDNALVPHTLRLTSDIDEVFEQSGENCIYEVGLLEARGSNDCAGLAQTRVRSNQAFQIQEIQDPMCELNVLPVVFSADQRMQPCRIEKAYVSELGDWAMLSVQCDSDLGRLTAIHSSWILQSSKLRLNTTYQAALAFWAEDMFADDGSEVTPIVATPGDLNRTLAHYTLNGTIASSRPMRANGVPMLRVALDLYFDDDEQPVTITAVVPSTRPRARLSPGQLVQMQGFWVISGLYQIPKDVLSSTAASGILLERQENDSFLSYRRRLRRLLKKSDLNPRDVVHCVQVLQSDNDEGFDETHLPPATDLTWLAAANGSLAHFLVLLRSLLSNNFPVGDRFERIVMYQALDRVVSESRKGQVDFVRTLSHPSAATLLGIPKDLVHDMHVYLAQTTQEPLDISYLVNFFGRRASLAEPQSLRAHHYFSNVLQYYKVNITLGAVWQLTEAMYKGVGNKNDPWDAATLLVFHQGSNVLLSHCQQNLARHFELFFEPDLRMAKLMAEEASDTGSCALIYELCCLAKCWIETTDNEAFYIVLKGLAALLRKRSGSDAYVRPFFLTCAAYEKFHGLPARMPGPKDTARAWKLLDAEEPKHTSSLADNVGEFPMLGSDFLTYFETILKSDLDEVRSQWNVIEPLTSLETIQNNAEVLFSTEQLGELDAPIRTQLLRYEPPSDKGELLVATARQPSGKIQVLATYPVFKGAQAISLRLLSGYCVPYAPIACVSAVLSNAPSAMVVYFCECRWSMVMHDYDSGDCTDVDLFAVGSIKPKPSEQPIAKVCHCINAYRCAYAIEGPVREVEHHYANLAGVQFSRIVVDVHFDVFGKEPYPLAVYTANLSALEVAPGQVVTGVVELAGGIAPKRTLGTQMLAHVDFGVMH